MAETQWQKEFSELRRQDYSETYKHLFERVKSLVATGSHPESGSVIQHADSLLRRNFSGRADQPELPTIVIDAGGTNTKVALWTPQEKIMSSADPAAAWQMLFSKPNDQFHSKELPDSLSLIEKYFTSLFGFIKKHLVDQEVSNINLALIWSNGQQNYRCPQGIGARVYGREYNYNKHEWFTRDLVDGEALDPYLVAQAEAVGFSVENLIISNDTVATALAAKQAADAGMVLSTGLNLAVLQPSKRITGELTFCNTEIGSGLQAADLIGNDYDYIARRVKAKTIENFCSGLFLPELVDSYAICAYDRGESHLEDLVALIRLEDEQRKPSHALKTYTVGNRFITEITTDLNTDQEIKIHENTFSPAVRKTLKEICDFVITRSAHCSAIMALGSLSQATDYLFLGLDSKLARSNSAYKKVFFDAIDQLQSKYVEIDLTNPVALKKNQEISVPMLGIKNAFSSLN